VGKIKRIDAQITREFIIRNDFLKNVWMKAANNQEMQAGKVKLKEISLFSFPALIMFNLQEMQPNRDALGTTTTRQQIQI